MSDLLNSGNTMEEGSLYDYLMTFQNKLTEIGNLNHIYIGNGQLDHQLLNNPTILDNIKSFPEFKNCDVTIDNTLSDKSTIFLAEGDTLEGKIKILSIGLTDMSYDPKTYNKPVKDGASLFPVIYNSDTFQPYRKLSINLGVEDFLNNPKKSGEDLHKLIDKIISDPYEYITKGTQRLYVRAKFEGSINSIKPVVA